MSRIARIAMVASFTVALALPAAAGARPLQHGFNQTFPIASRLCNHAANGHLPKALAGDAAQVAAACTTLRTSFTDAQNAWESTVGPLKTQAQQALQTLHQDCKIDRQNNNRQACRNERQATKAEILNLRSQVVTATLTYHESVQAARKTFWATIHSLKGGSAVPGDSTVGASPTNPLPSSSAVDGASQ